MASALGTAEPGARAALAERGWGAARYVLSFRRLFKKKGGVGFKHRRARGSGGACRARLGGDSPCPLALPPVQEEGRRWLWEPRTVLAERELGTARHVLSFRR